MIKIKECKLGERYFIKCPKCGKAVEYNKKCKCGYSNLDEYLKNIFKKISHQIVEIILPQYEFHIKLNNKWIPSGHYVRGKIINEVGDSAYRIKLFIEGEPEVVAYYKDLKFI